MGCTSAQRHGRGYDDGSVFFAGPSQDINEKCHNLLHCLLGGSSLGLQYLVLSQTLCICPLCGVFQPSGYWGVLLYDERRQSVSVALQDISQLLSAFAVCFSGCGYIMMVVWRKHMDRHSDTDDSYGGDPFLFTE